MIEKTLAEQVGALVTLSLSCPSMGTSLGGGSKLEEEMQDRWARQVHVEASRVHRLALGVDPVAVRIVEQVQDEMRRSSPTCLSAAA